MKIFEDSGTLTVTAEGKSGLLYTCTCHRKDGELLARLEGVLLECKTLAESNKDSLCDDEILVYQDEFDIETLLAEEEKSPNPAQPLNL